jgi:phosphoribosylformylglycinamidine synthase
MRGAIGNDVPRVDPASGKRIMISLTKAIKKGLVVSCHDCSDGGMAVALAEMSFAGGLGMNIRLDPYAMPTGQELLMSDIQLFSESNTRFIVEVKDEAEFVKAMKGLSVWKLGEVRKDNKFRIYNFEGKLIINSNTDKLKRAWQRPFKEM